MNTEIITQADSIQITYSNLVVSKFLESQLFGVVVGALITFFGSLLIFLIDRFSRYLKRRKAFLREYYIAFLKDTHLVDAETIYNTSRHYKYEHTDTRNGKTIEYPEKPINEKMMIEFKKSINYRRLPFSKLRGLLKKMEDEISTLDPSKMEVEILKINKIKETILTHCRDKSGEDEHTVQYI